MTHYYAAQIDAVKGGLSPRDIAGAVRAIRAEMAGAIRAVLERWNAAKAAAAQRQAPKTPTDIRAPVRPAKGREPT